MDKHLPVLIVGAGPTGLFLACELVRYGVPFRIIDKKLEPTKTSNATWVHARTLEILESLDLTLQIIKAGHVCNGLSLYIEGKKTLTIPMKQISSVYPYILMVAQSTLEDILIQYLEKAGIHIERGIELLEVEQTPTFTVVKVNNTREEIETIQSRWLVACDGANSTVRNLCGMTFKGADFSEQFVVADADIHSYIANDQIHLFFDKHTIFMAAPLQGSRYRITANIHLPVPRSLFTEHEVIEMAQERAHGEYYVKSVAWISPFWIHSKIVKRMQIGAIFLAGDAAHIHSPIGGQGMNMGMQDAHNLAWKLALVAKAEAKPTLLNSYQAERYPVDKAIVAKTEQLTDLAIFNKTFFTKLRRCSDKFKKNKLTLAKQVGNELSQVSIKYVKSPIIRYAGVRNKKSPQPGERIPGMLAFNNALHNIIVFTGAKLAKNKLQELIELQQWSQHCQDKVQVHIVSVGPLAGLHNVIPDKKQKIHQFYQVKKQAVYVVRPDNYIAYCAKSVDRRDIVRFLRSYLCVG